MLELWRRGSGGWDSGGRSRPWRRDGDRARRRRRRARRRSGPGALRRGRQARGAHRLRPARAAALRAPLRCVTIRVPDPCEPGSRTRRRESDLSDAPKKIKLDMHTHCEYSPDSRTPVAVQALAIKAAGLDVVCATDHNTIEGALRLRELADGFRVIIGEEVSSRDGEIIGLFLEKAIPRDLSAEETIARIHDQGGLVSVPHPYTHNRIYPIPPQSLAPP